MNHITVTFFLILFMMFIMQSLCTWLQMKDFQKSIKRVHKYGNVGLGQKRGAFRPGYLTAIACDNNGIIVYGEHMTGLSILSKCRPFEKVMGKNIIGLHIDELMDEFRKLDKKGFQKYKGYIQAVDALERRLYPERFDPDELPKLSLEPRIHHRKNEC